MTKFFKIGCAALLVLGAAMTATVPAHSQQANSGTPFVVQPNPLEMVQVAQRIGVAMDRGDPDQLWGASSALLRRSFTREQFRESVNRRRQAWGALNNRSWRSIQRQTLAQAQGQMPQGDYLNVVFRAQDKNNRFVTETVSFVLQREANNEQWRLVGVVVN